MSERIRFLLAGGLIGAIAGAFIGYWLINPVMAHEALDTRPKCLAYYSTRVQTDKAAQMAFAACEALAPSY